MSHVGVERAIECAARASVPLGKCLGRDGAGYGCLGPPTGTGVDASDCLLDLAGTLWLWADWNAADRKLLSLRVKPVPESVPAMPQS